jgi:hypothetical protein
LRREQVGNRIDVLPGKWIVFEHCSPDIEAHEVQTLFRDCIGIEIEEERISIKPGSLAVIVSLSDDHIRDIMAWAFQQTSLAGKPVCVRTRILARN